MPITSASTIGRAKTMSIPMAINAVRMSSIVMRLSLLLSFHELLDNGPDLTENPDDQDERGTHAYHHNNTVGKLIEHLDKQVHGIVLLSLVAGFGE
jgi:hypothetical protein